MPVRFTSPGLAGKTASSLKPRQWQIDVAYRHLYADEWFVGTEVKESAAPFGQPLYLNINSIDLGIEYGVTNQLSLVLTLPFSHGSQSRYYPDQQRHRVSGSGLGDMSLVANYWLVNPFKPARGNCAVGVGVKMPTGSNTLSQEVALASGTVVQPPMDQSVQLGDGGWGVILQVQAYRQLYRKLSAYSYGWYLISPEDKTGVPSPIKGVTLSIPDVYSFRAGTSYAISLKHGFSGTFGARIDGIPTYDLIGSSNGFRRPGYTLYLEPGVTFGRGSSTFTLTVPFRVHQNFKRGPVDVQNDFAGGGDLANSLVLMGYSVRF